jgi:hypothetical protein
MKAQKTLIAILEGIFSSPSMADSIMDASTETLSNDLLIDAIALLGDASPNLSGILTHSAVQFDLAKKRLLDPKTGEPGTKDAPEFDTYLKRRVIVDDGAPRTAGVYTTYFFGTGSIAFAEGTPKNPVEIERQGTKSVDVLINRREFIMHPRGVKWVGTAADTTPSNTELATGANWARVFENKSIHIVALKHMIGG